MRRNGILLMLFVLLVASCSPEKKVQKAFEQGKYQSVIDQYKNVLAKDPNNGRANFFIAESYRLSNRLQEAEPYYRKAGGRGTDRDTVMFFHAQALKANGNYAEARTKLAELESNGEDEKMKSLARKTLNGIDYLDQLEQKQSYYRIKSLDALNTPFAEFSPVHLNGELYFTSSRGNANLYEASNTPYTDLFKVTTKGANIDESTVAPLPKIINDEIRHEACITFSPDGKTMVFARGNTKKKNGGYDVDLFISRFRSGAWSLPELVNVNTTIDEKNKLQEAKSNSWDSSPAFSPDGRTLYFSSNRKGGFGGNDLYSAQVDARGRFGRIRNLGPDINTSGNEQFPYVSDNGKLYFASDGHPGYGMLDMFVVNRAGGKTVTENLGKPMNSTSDDFGIFLFKPDRGFFTSNREGGKGDDDIYTFINEDPNLKVVNYYLQGITYTWGQDSTLVLLPETKVTLLDGRGETMMDFETGNDGKFLFRVYENENYHLVGETDGYLVKRQSYTTLGKSVPLESLKELVTNVTLDTILVLDRLEKNKVFALQNIYFGYDSANIRPASALELDKLVEVLNDNPEIKIEMSSHTDSVGTHERNMGLSQRRAAATVAYLIKKGIPAERLVAKGYGETKPIARNTNRDGTDNPDGRQRNRRTEFKILEIGIMPVKKPGEEDEDDKFFKKNNNNNNGY